MWYKICSIESKTTEYPEPSVAIRTMKLHVLLSFLLVAASPLTRSSYHAGDDFARMKAAREAQLAKA